MTDHERNPEAGIAVPDAGRPAPSSFADILQRNNPRLFAALSEAVAAVSDDLDRQLLETWRGYCWEEMSRMSRKSEKGMLARADLPHLLDALLAALGSLRQVSEHCRLELSQRTRRNLALFTVFLASLQNFEEYVSSEMLEKNFPAVQEHLDYMIADIAAEREIRVPEDFGKWLAARRSRAYDAYS